SDESWAALSADAETARALAPRRRDGLTAADAEVLRARLGARASELSVHRGVPFAAWILVGALLTLWRPGTVVSWLLPYAEKAWRLAGFLGGRG
ncbi:MAG: hypothetical protein KGM24_11605, partial [Elusimicrobia bacterium]|nr:hypothetical protein [Elusimicrobiota bacterium]